MVKRKQSYRAVSPRHRLRQVARALMFVVLVVVAVGIYANATNYPLPYLNPPLPNSMLSFSIDWPPSSAGVQNALAYNGSMHIDLFLVSAGSIIQGQRVWIEASGGMTPAFSKEVQEVILDFPGSLPCYLEGCVGQTYTTGMNGMGAILKQNYFTPGYPPVTEIGPVSFPISLGFTDNLTNYFGYPMDYQSSGTYYPAIELAYSNGTSSKPYTFQTMPISVAPSDVAISERGVRFAEFVGVAGIVVVFVEIGLSYVDKE